MNKRKIIITAAAVVVTIILGVVLIMVALKQDNDQPANSTENNQTTETAAEESTQPTDSEDEDESIPETSNSEIVSSFDGEKEKAYLDKYGLTAYESPFAAVGGVNGLRYVDIGDGVEIYQGDAFAGWFAAWDFSDVSELGEDKIISDENINAYVERKIGGVDSMGITRVGREELSDKVVRYDYELKVLAQSGDDWLVTSGIYNSEDDMLKRGTYTLNVSAYCAKESNYGYILCTETSVVDDETAEKLTDAVSFWSSSFKETRTTLEDGRTAQEMYAAVEKNYPAVVSYLEMCQWFKDYNGEKIQRIEGTTDDNYSPATCPDIIFYRADADEDIDDVVAAMFKAIMEPLKEESSARLFTVTKYFLDQQEITIYEGRENTWLLPFLNGYYAYEGTDGVTMTTAKAGGNTKEGMVPLFRQGSDETFQFVLMKEGNVWRLQRAADMGLEVETKEK